MTKLHVGAIIAVGLLCGACAGKRAGGGHGRGETNLVKAEKACPGPQGKVVVRVLDSPTLEPGDTLAFVREPEVHWVVALQVVETVEGEPIGARLGVLVHSPSMFASEVWGLMASPQEHPAQLELRWAADYCMFEVAGATKPTVELKAGDPAPFKVPSVHSMIVG